MLFVTIYDHVNRLLGDIMFIDAAPAAGLSSRIYVVGVVRTGGPEPCLLKSRGSWLRLYTIVHDRNTSVKNRSPCILHVIVSCMGLFS